MIATHRLAVPAAFAFFWAFAAGPWATAGDPADDALASYRESIRPLLAERCYGCHGGLAQEASLRLDTVGLMEQGGDSGAAIVPGKPAESLLLARVRDPDPASRMPPEGEGEPLTTAQQTLIESWLAAGAPRPEGERPEEDPRKHWAFQPRVRPAVPSAGDGWARNPIDAFLAASHEKAGLWPQPEAPRHVLVRRLYLDLIGLPPQPEELAAVEADPAADWYERLVDTLLADPRHGERWARHWMDVWRYADKWGLGEGSHRNSQKHIWHFRDWIVESLNADLGYDEMVRQMLAADELYPEDPARLRATGFLGRNWFVFNRTPWLDETVEHVGKGLLGLTMNCSKCHAHKYDPISQEDYFKFRAFFEPIETRLDVVTGEGDVEKDGIPRVFDGHLDRPTYLFVRGDDTKPDTSKKIEPGVPDVIAFRVLDVRPVSLPLAAFQPERRPWVIDAHLATATRAVAAAEAKQAQDPSAANGHAVLAAKAALVAVERRAEAMRAAWSANDAPSQSPDDPLRVAAVAAAKAAAKAEMDAAVAAAWATIAGVSTKLTKAVAEQKDAASREPIEEELAAARESLDKAVKAAAEPGEAFTPLAGAHWTATRFKTSTADDPTVPFPATSTGRRTALARWITDPRNPLTARVAVNHIWMRHIGKPLVTTVFEFGRKGNAPTHPELLDWLASELVDGPQQAGEGGGRGWSMKHLHRLICLSAAYRMGSATTGAEAALKADPDNLLLWRREPVRLEAQVVRDGILTLAGTLDSTMGGPPVPESRQATSRRRSLYFWHSDISRNLFLTTFDDAGVMECYQRDQSIVPQQALALSNAALVHDAAATIAERLEAAGGPAGDAGFIERAFLTILQRGPSPAERAACEAAMARGREAATPGAEASDPARPLMVWALVNHNDFVTLR